MEENSNPRVAILDYGLGNLFSVKHACEHTGLTGIITNDVTEIEQSDAIILPGIGAFGDAMNSLRELGMINPIVDWAAEGKPIMGICLGMQLLMTESHEFGYHKGLGLIEGEVVKFEPEQGNNGRVVKVPHIGWNQVYLQGGDSKESKQDILAGIEDGDFFYFVHSYYVRPTALEVIRAISNYGNIEFCAALQFKNIFATQFHPERSATKGLNIYRNFATQVRANLQPNQSKGIRTE